MELDTDARLRLWLAPEWARPGTWLPALSAYLRVAHPAGSTCLCLAAGREPVALVTELVTVACERLAGDTPFGEVLIVGESVVPAAVAPVGSASEVLAALAAPPPATAPDPGDLALAGDLAAELCAMTASPPPAGTERWLRDVRRVVPYH